MAHKVYISFKTEDIGYRDAITTLPKIDYIDKSLQEPITSDDQDYVMQRIRSDYLYDSTVTIFLIGEYGAEVRGELEQYYIKKELQGSLYNSSLHPKNGILGVVLPSMQARIYAGTVKCSACGGTHNQVCLNDSTVIKEFSYNYYLPQAGCAWFESDRYCVMTSWESFCADPNGFIDQAFDKRDDPIADKTRVRP